MKKTKITFISKGFRSILLSEGAKDIVLDAAQNIQKKANDSVGEESEGYSVTTQRVAYGGGRWSASVTATDRASQTAESENKALSKAVK